jgi:hypothetical protein
MNYKMTSLYMTTQLIVILLIIIFSVIVYVVITAVKIKNRIKKLAISGFDLVAYLERNDAIAGLREINVTYKNKIYYFSSEDHKQKFIENPSRYLPQYGGYCSYGMSKGYKETIKPEAFTVVDNKLYFNYNLQYRAYWLENRDERIQWANDNWEKFENKKKSR